MEAIVLDTPKQINTFVLLTLRQCLSLHIKSQGTRRWTRSATPTFMREKATEFTGKQYARGMGGLQDALKDLDEMWEHILFLRNNH